MNSAYLSSVSASDEIVANAIAQAGRAGCDIAAVDGDLGTTDKARLVRRQEEHKIGAFIWRALPVQRNSSARSMGKCLAAAAKETGVGDLSGMDRIDPNVPLGKLQDRRLGQSAQPPLARGVSCVVMCG